MAIALYARKSIEKENSISCETQLEYCKAMIKPEERQQEVLQFVDNGFSGGNINRDGFQKMMRKIEKGKITKVIVYRLDRISRSLSDFVGILNTFQQHGVEFVSSQESFDTSSPYGDLIVKILVVFAEFERNSIIARVTQAYEHRSEMGFYMGGRKPYGFDLAPVLINHIKTKKYVPVPQEIQHIRHIFDTYSQENVTLNSLLMDLKENGMVPSLRGGWTTAKLSTILKNPIYVRADHSIYEYFKAYGTQIASNPECFDGVHGLQLYGRTKHEPDSLDWSDMRLVVMNHEGAVHSDIWLKCQEKLALNRQIRNAVSNKTSWLGGKLVCSKCGRTMTTIKGKRNKENEFRRYFICTGKSHFKNCTGTKVTIYAESIEHMVCHAISEKLKGIRSVRRCVNTECMVEINELKNRITAIELNENSLMEGLLGGHFSEDLVKLANEKASTWGKEKLALLARIKELQGQDQKRERVIHFSDRWKTASFEEKRAVCNILIHRVIIYENGDAEIVWMC